MAKRIRFDIYEGGNIVESNVTFTRLKERCITIFSMYKRDCIEEKDIKSARGWSRYIADIRKMTLTRLDLERLQWFYENNGETFVAKDKEGCANTWE